jgi:hypothetical protein
MADLHKLKQIIDLKYTGTLQEWQLSSVKRSEEIVIFAQYRWASILIQRQWKKIYAKKLNAAYTIQKYWRHAITNPTHKVCRQRLHWEFQNL